MPYCPDPINASPEILRRIRWYRGADVMIYVLFVRVLAFCSGGDFCGEVSFFLLNAFAKGKAREALH
jgi:hypothetical protein